MGDAPIYGRHLLLKRDRPKQRNPLASSPEMMAQSSTPTRVNRYITMTKIAKLATQGATRLGKSGGLQSLSGGFQRHYFPFKDGDRKKTTTLDVQEFISRFLLHVLPEGFVRIRHFGFLANRSKKQILAQCRKLLKLDPAAPE